MFMCTAAATVILTALRGCNEPDYYGARYAEPRVRAADVHIVVGDRPFVLPVVNVGQVSRSSPSYLQFSPVDEDTGADDSRRLREEAGNPQKPLVADMLQIVFDGLLGDCALLKREWSEQLCRGVKPELLGDLPQRITLFDTRYLEGDNSRYYVGRESRAAQAAAVASERHLPNVACDEPGKFCTAAIAIAPGLNVVWTVWDHAPTNERATDMAGRQAPAIRAFVEHAIGPAEDFSRLSADP